jgi:hypothetical protein
VEAGTSGSSGSEDWRSKWNIRIVEVQDQVEAEHQECGSTEHLTTEVQDLVEVQEHLTSRNIRI